MSIAILKGCIVSHGHNGFKLMEVRMYLFQRCNLNEVMWGAGGGISANPHIVFLKRPGSALSPSPSCI